MTTVPQQNDEPNFARAWRFDEDGLRVDGTFLRLEEGLTEYGRKPIVVLSVDGTERALWLSQEALRSKFTQEIERRAAADFTAGERIVVERGAEKKKSQNDRSYWPFVVKFLDVPQRSAAEILATDERGDDGDDDLPF